MQKTVHKDLALPGYLSQISQIENITKEEKNRYRLMTQMKDVADSLKTLAKLYNHSNELKEQNMKYKEDFKQITETLASFHDSKKLNEEKELIERKVTSYSQQFNDILIQTQDQIQKTQQIHNIITKITHTTQQTKELIQTNKSLKLNLKQRGLSEKQYEEMYFEYDKLKFRTEERISNLLKNNKALHEKKQTVSDNAKINLQEVKEQVGSLQAQLEKEVHQQFSVEIGKVKNKVKEFQSQFDVPLNEFVNSECTSAMKELNEFLKSKKNGSLQLRKQKLPEIVTESSQTLNNQIMEKIALNRFLNPKIQEQAGQEVLNLIKLWIEFKDISETLKKMNTILSIYKIEDEKVRLFLKDAKSPPLSFAVNLCQHHFEAIELSCKNSILDLDNKIKELQNIFEELKKDTNSLSETVDSVNQLESTLNAIQHGLNFLIHNLLKLKPENVMRKSSYSSKGSKREVDEANEDNGHSLSPHKLSILKPIIQKNKNVVKGKRLENLDEQFINYIEMDNQILNPQPFFRSEEIQRKFDNFINE